MKIVLIAPPYPLEEGVSVPLGLCYAAAAFEKANADVIILDYLIRKYSPEKLISELSDINPDVIGITSVTMNFGIAASIIKTAKEKFPSSITIMGGPHVSFDYENTLKLYPEVDLIVIGEGEQTIAELVPVIQDRNSWKHVNGIAFKDNGSIIVTPQRQLIPDLDSLPLPARHLLPMSRYLALGFPINIITSRGCPNRCIFCQGHRMVGHKIRSRNPLLVVDEIESLLAEGFKRINFSDDFFTSNARRVKEICDEILRRGLSFEWTVFARADSVDRELLTIMHECGCDTVLFGIESGNQQMLDRIHKRIKLDRIRKAVADCKAVGMTVFGSFIAGLPGETSDTLMETHRFAEELDIVYGCHFLAPFPGTEVWKHADQYDIEILSEDWAMFDANQPIVRTSALKPEDIKAFVERYYLQPARDRNADMEKRYHEGRVSQDEQLTCLGNQKLDIVFKLLSQDIIETTGMIPFPSEDKEQAVILSENVAKRINNSYDFILFSIRHLLDKGYLKHTINNDNHLWYWEDIRDEQGIGVNSSFLTTG